jgi:hypothetical protein
MESPQQRLKFEQVVHRAAMDGRCWIGVRLEWRGRPLQASVEGLETQHGQVRAAAAAALKACMEAGGGDLRLDLVGVKAFRAFDGWVVVVRINGEAEARSYRLLGSASCESDEALTRASVQAVLDATNRVLARFLDRE